MVLEKQRRLDEALRLGAVAKPSTIMNGKNSRSSKRSIFTYRIQFTPASVPFDCTPCCACKYVLLEPEKERSFEKRVKLESAHKEKRNDNCKRALKKYGSLTKKKYDRKGLKEGKEAPKRKKFKKTKVAGNFKDKAMSEIKKHFRKMN